MTLDQLSNKVAEQRTRFVDFLKSKEQMTSAEYEEAEKMEKDLKATEDEHTRAAALKARQDELEQKFAAEKQELALSRPALAPVMTKKADDESLDYDEPVNISQPRVLSTIFFTSPGYKALAKQGAWPMDNQRIEAKGSYRAQIGFKAAGDPIMTTNFNVIRTDLDITSHFFTVPRVYDMVPKVAANASSIRVLMATTPLANTAAAVAEGAVKPEAQPRWAPVDVPLETIAVWTAVTVQALADVPALRTLIDNDLRSMVLDRTDDLIINGTGTPPQLKGLLVWATNTPIAGDTIVATSNAITQMVSTGAGTPSAIILNPTDWQAVRVFGGPMGMYYWGPPTEQGTMRMWGVPVVVSPRMPAGKGIVADMSYVTFFQSMGITFIVGWKNDDIIKNIQTIVCELRGALVVRRPEAVLELAVTAPVAVLRTQTVV